jgi:hypothetical protein
MGVQWEMREDILLRLLADVGRTFDLLVDQEKKRLPAELTELRGARATFGFGIEVGVRTPLGPASVVLSSDTLSDTPELWVGLGYNF